MSETTRQGAGTPEAKEGTGVGKGLSHGERVLTGRIGAGTMLSRHDAHEVTRAARKAFWSKFERDVDPEGVLPPRGAGPTG